MSTVTLEDAKRRLGELVKSLPTEGEILITDGAKTVAKLGPVFPKPSVRDRKPVTVGGLLKPYPHPDDDILGEMLADKADKLFPKPDAQ